MSVSSNMQCVNQSTFFEVNFDGIVGPTHNYSGLSAGNLASMRSVNAQSNPQEAALQGLNKMRFLLRKGVKQAALPPQQRPCPYLLDNLGYTKDFFTLTNTSLINEVASQGASDQRYFARQLMSASSMWVANAATISPSTDTADKRVHLTVANLANALHRSMEVPQTTHVLNTIFNNQKHFVVHPAIVSHSVIGDEGAANHGRLCSRHDQPGVEVFVYGKSAFLEERSGFPCRQSVEASKAVARNHGLSYENSIFLQQSKEAIDAGVFHNDVISVINENVFLLHEKSFVNQTEEMNVIRRKCSFDVCFLSISEEELSLEDAISSYFFNSQLITLPDGSMVLLMPKEVEENAKAFKCVNRLIDDDSNPINSRIFLDLKQSMKNGGGPACLRLRVLLSQDQIDALGGDVMMSESKLDELERIVKTYYREKITPDDLFESDFIKDSYCALREIAECLSLREIYDFSK